MLLSQLERKRKAIPRPNPNDIQPFTSFSTGGVSQGNPNLDPYLSDQLDGGSSGTSPGEDTVVLFNTPVNNDQTTYLKGAELLYQQRL